MCGNCQSMVLVSCEYIKFIKEYHNFLKYSILTRVLCLTIKLLLKCGNAQVVNLYTQALKAHLATTQAYLHLLVLQEELFQKYWPKPCEDQF